MSADPRYVSDLANDAEESEVVMVFCDGCGAELPEEEMGYFGSHDLCPSCSVAARKLHGRAPSRTACAKCGGAHDGSVDSGREWFMRHDCMALAVAA